MEKVFGLIYVLDASALLNNENFSFEKGNKYFTTNPVFDEWKDVRSKSLAQSALESGFLTVQDSCPSSLQITYDKLEKSGTELSNADTSIVALAVEFREFKKKFVVITDDYSIQNILKKLDIKFQGIIHGEIKKHKNFKKN